MTHACKKARISKKEKGFWQLLQQEKQCIRSGEKGLKKVVLRSQDWNWQWKSRACSLISSTSKQQPCVWAPISRTHASSELAEPLRANASLEMWTGPSPASYIISTAVDGVSSKELLFMRMQSELEENRRTPPTSHIFTCRYLYVHILKAVLDLSCKTSNVKERWFEW